MSDVEDVPETQLEIDVSDGAGLEEEDDDDMEQITAQKVLEILETAWINEMCAPEILPSQTDMLELMVSQVAHMEEQMRDLDKNDFRAVVHSMELERVRYIMASYLRCRLQKIETFTQHILNQEASREPDDKRLSPEETKFAQEFAANVDEYFHKVATQYMPNQQRGEAEQRIVTPNLMSHVFLKANVAVPAVIVGVDDEEVDMAAGSQHIIPYQLVADLIQNNQAQLI
ncbi:DNA replication complex GINS protein SLD5 [Drosophila subpulchrella]|uniref:DNA replication complex GINS protein SLD5 n=1 Tax=Drosophila biarmipes TaxID=125945 RepID=UPI0007E80D10|nr:DNA replication complex GINS protein SLD5 [Drosophila biarmipes]XP_037727070.1 DNA replication complex GINS protein SLD5 [Drosophila subpulchrella]